jgi:hypothetical protein
MITADEYVRSDVDAPAPPETKEEAKPASKLVKVNVELTEGQIRRLRSLSDFEGKSCNTIIQRAIYLHEYVVREQMKGGKLLVEKPDGSLRRVAWDEDK